MCSSGAMLETAEKISVRSRGTKVEEGGSRGAQMRGQNSSSYCSCDQAIWGWGGEVLSQVVIKFDVF